MTTVRSLTTGIGSLPHHNIDTALEYSFKLGIPFLPQIPIRNPWEYMIAQALEGLPGLQAEEDGSATLHFDIWLSRTHELNRKLSESFEKSPTQVSAFELFEPSGAALSCWQPFLWELQERGCRFAKIQMVGPMTAQWAIRVKDKTSSTLKPHFDSTDLSSQIYRLMLARSLAMTRRLRASGIQILFFLDEPGLYGFSVTHPRHVLGFQELKLMIQTLRKEGAQVGLHCCSNTDWVSILSLPLDYLSIDTALSLQEILSLNQGNTLEEWIQNGSKLSLGVIPTSRSSVIRSLNTRDLFIKLYEEFKTVWIKKPELIQKVLSDALYTPACGLVFHSVADSESVLEALIEFSALCRSTFRNPYAS